MTEMGTQAVGTGMAMDRIRTASRGKVHYANPSQEGGDAATLCGRGADRIIPTGREVDCKACLNAQAKAKLRAEIAAEIDAKVAKGLEANARRARREEAREEREAAQGLAEWERDLAGDSATTPNPHAGCDLHGVVCPTGEHRAHEGTGRAGCAKCVLASAEAPSCECPTPEAFHYSGCPVMVAAYRGRTADGHAIVDGMAVWDYNRDAGYVSLASLSSDGWFTVSRVKGDRRGSLMNAERVAVRDAGTGQLASDALAPAVVIQGGRVHSEGAPCGRVYDDERISGVDTDAPADCPVCLSQPTELIAGDGSVIRVGSRVAVIGAPTYDAEGWPVAPTTGTVEVLAECRDGEWVGLVTVREDRDRLPYGYAARSLATYAEGVAPSVAALSVALGSLLAGVSPVVDTDGWGPGAGDPLWIPSTMELIKSSGHTPRQEKWSALCLKCDWRPGHTYQGSVKGKQRAAKDAREHVCLPDEAEGLVSGDVVEAASQQVRPILDADTVAVRAMMSGDDTDVDYAVAALVEMLPKPRGREIHAAHAAGQAYPALPAVGDTVTYVDDSGDTHSWTGVVTAVITDHPEGTLVRLRSTWGSVILWSEWAHQVTVTPVVHVAGESKTSAEGARVTADAPVALVGEVVGPAARWDSADVMTWGHDMLDRCARHLGGDGSGMCGGCGADGAVHDAECLVDGAPVGVDSVRPRCSCAWHGCAHSAYGCGERVLSDTVTSCEACVATVATSVPLTVADVREMMSPEEAVKVLHSRERRWARRRKASGSRNAPKRPVRAS